MNKTADVKMRGNFQYLGFVIKAIKLLLTELVGQCRSILPLAFSQGGRGFLMSGLRVCATEQGRFFTSKSPEQAPNFEVSLQNRPYFLKFYSRTGSCFDNLVSNAPAQMSKTSCFRLLFPAA